MTHLFSSLPRGDQEGLSLCHCERRSGPIAIRVRLILVVILVLPAASGCERSQPADSDPGARSASPASIQTSSDEVLSPLETLRRVRGHRLSGQLDLIGPYLPPDHRASVIDLIQSMDRLLWANDVLQAAVTRHFGPATARAFDRSESANAIGVFSRDVEPLDQRVQGDTAVVVFQVAGRVPLEEVTLARHDDRWLIQTDPPIPGVAKALRDLAQMLVDTAQMLDDRPMSAAQLHRELATREASIGRQIKKLTDNP